MIRIANGFDIINIRFSNNGDNRFGNDEFELEVDIKITQDAGGWHCSVE